MKQVLTPILAGLLLTVVVAPSAHAQDVQAAVQAGDPPDLVRQAALDQLGIGQASSVMAVNDITIEAEDKEFLVFVEPSQVSNQGSAVDLDEAFAGPYPDEPTHSSTVSRNQP